MKLIIQRVTQACVTKTDTNEIVGQIDKGLFCLLGIKKGDTKENAEKLATKLVKLRLMSDPTTPEATRGTVNQTVDEVGGKFLIVSQFTLYANTKDGNRPSFIDAENPEKAKVLYEYFINKLKETGAEVQTGSFGDYMNISASLEGPVTIILEN